jgi:hypothetical protein
MHLFAVDSLGEFGIIAGMVAAIIGVFTTAIYKIVRMMWDDNKARLDAQELRHSAEINRIEAGHLAELQRHGFRNKAGG